MGHFFLCLVTVTSLVTFSRCLANAFAQFGLSGYEVGFGKLSDKKNQRLTWSVPSQSSRGFRKTLSVLHLAFLVGKATQYDNLWQMLALEKQMTQCLPQKWSTFLCRLWTFIIDTLKRLGADSYDSCVCVCSQVHTCHSMHVEGRGQPLRCAYLPSILFEAGALVHGCVFHGGL